MDSFVYLFASNNAIGPYKKIYTFSGYTGQLFNGLRIPYRLMSLQDLDDLFVKFIFVKDGPYDYFSSVH